MENLLGWDKYNYEEKQKLHTETEQKKGFIHYIPSAGRRPDTFWKAGPQYA